MSEEQLANFLEAAKHNADLQAKLKQAYSNSSAIVAIAEEAGFSISNNQAECLQSEPLTDEELESAAGGLGLKPSDRKIFDRRIGGIACA
jgi:predicted ribosomally synthesized peptide with nif11-like leader